VHHGVTVERVAVPSRHELRRLLRVAAAHPVPPLDVASLAACAPRPPALEPPLAFPARRRDGGRTRRPAVLTGAAAAAMTLVIAGTLTVVVAGRGDGGDLVLGVAVDTSVLLPDGRTLDGSRGLALPDGTLVRTGPSGRAVVGDVELGPSLEAIVDAGSLLPRGTAQASPAEPVIPESGDAAAATASLSVTGRTRGGQDETGAATEGAIASPSSGTRETRETASATEGEVAPGH
jgi:hypothetical protein